MSKKRPHSEVEYSDYEDIDWLFYEDEGEETINKATTETDDDNIIKNRENKVYIRFTLKCISK